MYVDEHIKCAFSCILMLLATVVYFYKSNITENGDKRSLTHTLK
jgi:hypothetical protein